MTKKLLQRNGTNCVIYKTLLLDCAFDLNPLVSRIDTDAFERVLSDQCESCSGIIVKRGWIGGGCFGVGVI